MVGEYCRKCGVDIFPTIYDGNQQWIDDGYCTEECANETDYLPIVRPMANLFCQEFGIDKFSLQVINKHLFRGTEFGLSLGIHNNTTVRLQGIVEGTDIELGPFVLVWPFTSDDFWKSVESMDELGNDCLAEWEAQED
jgi:hypothetical protein